MEENKIINIDKKTDEEKRIPVLDFLTKYNGMTSDKAKEAYIKRVVRPDNYYVPYISKTVYANQILEIANFTKEGKVYFNGAKQYQLYIWTLLTLYTFFDVPNEGFEIIFDVLNQQGFLDILIDQMPNDKAEFDVVYHLSQKDFEKNYMETKVNTEDILNIINKGILDSMHIIIDEVTKVFNDKTIDVFAQLNDRANKQDELQN